MNRSVCHIYKLLNSYQLSEAAWLVWGVLELYIEPKSKQFTLSAWCNKRFNLGQKDMCKTTFQNDLHAIIAWFYEDAVWAVMRNFRFDLLISI